MLKSYSAGGTEKFTSEFPELKKVCTFAPGKVAEWSIAAVLKTVEGNTSGGSNPSLSAYSR
jgi:hypothetical protein